MSAKETVIEFIRGLPDDVSLADILTGLQLQLGEDEGENLTAEEWETDWAEECSRRVEEIRSGRAKLIPGDDVMRKLREKYG